MQGRQLLEAKRRYRFRILDAGPSRFYELYLTNPDNPKQSVPYSTVMGSMHDIAIGNPPSWYTDAATSCGA